MMNREIHNTLFPDMALDTQVISSDTTTVGNIIDTSDFESMEFYVLSGALTDGAYVPLIEEGDDPGLSDASEVSDDDLTTTEADASFADSDDFLVKRIGYVGNKRFIRLSIVSTGTSSGGTIGGLAVKGHARVAPVDGNA